MSEVLGETRDIQRRNAFVRHVVSTHADNSLNALKRHLFNAGMLASPRSKLDAVMVEDVDHFYTLIATEGIPLARDAAVRS